MNEKEGLMNIAQYFENRVRQNPDKIFIIEEINGYVIREFTYYQIYQAVRRTVANLARAGISQYDCVAIVLPNSPELIISWFAVNYLGAIAGLFEPVLSKEELLAKLDHLAPKLIVGKNNIDYLVSYNQPLSVDTPPIPARDPAAIVYSSGTTGNPKGVVESHFNYIFAGEGFAHWMQLSPDDRLYTCLSLTRINAQAYSVMGAIAAGATTIIGSKFDGSRGFWRKITNTKATIANTLGGMLRDLYNQPLCPEERRHNLRLFANGQALADGKFHETLEKRFGCKVIIMYGSTEQLFGFVMPLDSQKRGGNVVGKQKNHPNYPDSDFEAKTDESGELLLRSPFVTSYWRNPELTAEKWGNPRDGWYRTGDLFGFDNDGYAIFKGRKDDVIRHSGYLINPSDVENIIFRHEGIADVAVIGVRDNFGENIVKALVVLKDNVSLTVADLKNFCRNKLAPYKIPEQWEFVKELPKNSSGRTQKTLLN